MITEDLYELLGVKRDASENEIKKAYRKKSKEFHPDVGGDENMFKKISYANEILSNKEKRELYDKFGHDMGKQMQGYNDDDDLREFIRRSQEEFFGFNKMNAVPPITLRIPMTLKEMYYGLSKKFKYKVNKICPHCLGLKYIQSEGGSEEKCSVCNGAGMRMTQQGYMMIGQTCNACGGTGKIIKNGCKHCNSTGVEKIETTIELQIPKGIFENAQMIFNGYGNEQIINNKKINGDLIVVISQIEDENFIREGNDLHQILEVPIIDSIIGGETQIETISGEKKKFKLKVGTEAGEKFRLTGLGMPIINTNNYGSLYVHIKHKMPTKLSDKELELFNEIKKIQNGTIQY